MLWNNRAKITIWRGESMDQHEITNFPDQLPEILKKFGLDPSINRIEVEEDTLETVVLRMINAVQGQHHMEHEDD
jgi:hypothetical protein